MAYPRKCEGCGSHYATFSEHASVPHVTICATDGGTPSPWLPNKPGRVLEIGCRLCGAVFRWDYFGQGQGSRLGTSVGLVRGPMPDWRVDRGAALSNGRERARTPLAS